MVFDKELMFGLDWGKVYEKTDSWYLLYLRGCCVWEWGCNIFEDQVIFKIEVSLYIFVVVPFYDHKHFSVISGSFFDWWLFRDQDQDFSKLLTFPPKTLLSIDRSFYFFTVTFKKDRGNTFKELTPPPKNLKPPFKTHTHLQKRSTPLPLL